MLIRFAATLGLVLAAAVASAAAEAERLNDHVSRGTVTIMTDGLAQSSGFVTSLATELASAVDEEGRVRLLPVMGYGAEANVRDMLFLRGIDLGILNSDVLEYLRIEGQLPEAASRLRSIARLFEKRVIVIANESVSSTADLAGKPVLAAGSDGEARVTARTMFHLMGIEVALSQQDLDMGLSEVAEGRAAAIVMLARDLASIRGHIPAGAGLHALAVPFGERLAGVYDEARLDPVELPGLVPEEGLATLKLAAVLATFDWRPSHSRYGPVGNLIKALYAIVASVRRSGAGGVWSEFVPEDPIKGWEAYQPAKELAANLPPRAEHTALPEAPAIAVGSAVTASAPPVPGVAAPVAVVRILARETPGLIGKDLPGSGMLAEVLAASLGGDGSRRIEVASSSDPASGSVVFPVAREDCARATAAGTAVADCAGRILSEPVLSVLNVAFVREGSGITIANDNEAAGRSVCVAQDADLTRLLGTHQNWASEQLITVVRQPTLADCFASVAQGGAEAVLAGEIEGRMVLRSLGIAPEFDVLEPPVSILSLSIAVPETLEDAAALVQSINASLTANAGSGRTAEIVATHLANLVAPSGTN